MKDKLKDWHPTPKYQGIQKDLNDLTTTVLFVTGMLTAKQDWKSAAHLALALKRQGVDCDYLDPIIDKSGLRES